ncbi:MAG: dihydroorotate dehydrogenase electron transfer subunit [Clostridiales bacterium]|nr:dihydroorotate dehydrogenase electron transfer subunit [Clostridiales bacterium]
MLDITAKVIENRLLSEKGRIYSLTLDSPELSKDCLPGQFYEIKVGGLDSRFLLRRPFSVAFCDDKTVTIRYNVVGAGTEWMSGITPGQMLDVLGPLGRGWPVDKTKKTLLVGGSTGIFSVLGAASHLGDKSRAVLGFRSCDLVNSVEDFKAFGVPVSIITEDGSSGRKGLVTELVKEELDKNEYDTVFICGSTLMMKSVAELLKDYDVDCYVSIEERMACGVGACMGCVVKIKADNEQGWEYKRACAEGPVFNAAEVIW